MRWTLFILLIRCHQERAKTERDLALEQRAQQRREYELKLRSALDELESLKRQQKETEKIIKLKEQSDRRIGGEAL